MSSDKIIKILEKHLRTLGQKIRIDILKKLREADHSLSFSTLQRRVLKKNLNSTNFTYHLKSLEKIELISIDKNKKYYLTPMGKKIFENILSMEKVLNDQKKAIMIRTSKYSKEPFELSKIEEYLIKEGKIELFLAKKIAREVEERLSKTNIEYLTAPLIREYINVILLENGLEEVRHKLTRLGTPPYEVMKLFKNKNINPEKFTKILGSDVSEQFLLLNLLPKPFADMYLSGEIVLLNLNHWALRPLAVCLKTDFILDFLLKKKKLKDVNNFKDIKDVINAFLNFFNLIFALKPYFSEDILLGNFNNNFLPLFNFQGDIHYFTEIFVSQILNYNKIFGNGKSHLTLDFTDNSNPEIINKQTIFLTQILHEKKLNNDNIAPLILFDYSFMNNKSFENRVLDPILLSELNSNIIYYNSEISSVLNSTLINLNNFNKNNSISRQIILDKILINLHLIAMQSNGNDDKFYDIIQDKVNSIFEFFNYKKTFLNKRAFSIKGFNGLISELLNLDNDKWLNSTIKSISYLGLNEAIKIHCGIELDKVKSSANFAFKLLSTIKELINEKNKDENERYLLSQPHNGNYLPKNLSSQIIRKESNLSLERKIALFKRFEDIIDGGTVFDCSINSNQNSRRETLKLLLSSGLKAFKL
ncbi:MAG: anaerobic ribonucleoside-triphosphate reductase [Promethearchaeota archaeon]